MTDLSDFGVDVSEPDEDTNDRRDEDSTTRRSYPNGRCPAISVGTRRRCASPTSRMKATGRYCGTHGRGMNDPWSIDDPAEKLILVTGELDAMSLDELDADEVDFDLHRIQEAVETVDGGWDYAE